VAAAFALLWLVAFSVLGVLLAIVWGRVRDGDRVTLPLLLPTLIVGVLATYLAVKVVYEEIIPCQFIDQQYCAYGSTQYWDLFGWEF
jgi:hypothetical protein